MRGWMTWVTCLPGRSALFPFWAEQDTPLALALPVTRPGAFPASPVAQPGG